MKQAVDPVPTFGTSVAEALLPPSPHFGIGAYYSMGGGGGEAIDLSMKPL